MGGKRKGSQRPLFHYRQISNNYWVAAFSFQEDRRAFFLCSLKPNDFYKPFLFFHPLLITLGRKTEDVPFFEGERQHCLITRSYINISWHWHRAMAVRKVTTCPLPRWHVPMTNGRVQCSKNRLYFVRPKELNVVNVVNVYLLLYLLLGEFSSNVLYSLQNAC